MKNQTVRNQLEGIPEGYSIGAYKNKRYGITKTVFNQGKSYKVFAEELGGNNFISLNFYDTKQKDVLRSCEMPAQKVMHFLNHVTIINT